MENRKSYHNRSQRKVKKRWNGIVISLLVFFGVILVVWVGTNLFIKSFDQASTEDTYRSDTEDKVKNNDSDDTTPTEDEESVVVDDDADSADDNQSNTDTEEPASSEDETPTTSTDSENNGNWQPIGTEQSEPHISSYDKDSLDWKEKIEAIAYATKIPGDQMQLLWLGNNGDANSAYGVVTTANEKENPTVVYLEWVTNEGWKPTEVVKLSEHSVEKQEEIKAKYQGDDKEEE